MDRERSPGAREAQETWAVRQELWRLLEDLRSGEIGAEVGEQMVSVLDSLAGLDKAGPEADDEAPARSSSGEECQDEDGALREGGPVVG